MLYNIKNKYILSTCRPTQGKPHGFEESLRLLQQNLAHDADTHRSRDPYNQDTVARLDVFKLHEMLPCLRQMYNMRIYIAVNL